MQTKKQTMPIKVSEATTTQLDWLVAKCEGLGLAHKGFVVHYSDGEPDSWQPSTNWSQGGSIIEREEIATASQFDEWAAFQSHTVINGQLYKDYYGATLLIAAMRCYVASKLGDEVEIPVELI